MATKIKTATVKELAQMVLSIVNSDRYMLIAADGETGEGKSRLIDDLLHQISKLTKKPFSYQKNMTYDADEFYGMIDGDKRLDEYSCVNADELIKMFYKRKWHDSRQIEGVQLLNMIRDRHLFVGGCIPDFFDLDKGFMGRVSFWIHIHRRGLAWVFMKSDNPFAKDKWYINENEKMFNKYKNPYKSKNFVCQVYFDDWSPEQKEQYYEVRNSKRNDAYKKEELIGGKNKPLQYRDKNKQILSLVEYLMKEFKLSQKQVATIMGASQSYISQLKNGIISG